MDLFVYGTLMVPRVMQSVCGSTQKGVEAVLPNYRRRLVHGEVYPAIVPQRGEQVSGLLYRNLSDQEFNRLDIFEGSMYQRCRVEVVANGQPTVAQAYVLRPAFRRKLSDVPWSLEYFEVDGIEQFVTGYDGFLRTAVASDPND
mgnify:CR=1 FL=1